MVRQSIKKSYLLFLSLQISEIAIILISGIFGVCGLRCDILSTQNSTQHVVCTHYFITFINTMEKYTIKKELDK